ncbi:MAG: lamin tail domain-containing protein [Myxococcota bacterium]
MHSHHARIRTASAAVALAALFAGCTDDPKEPEVPDPGTDTETDAETGGDIETVPGETLPWLRQETAAPGSITFSEILYHPRSDEDVEWIELYNPMALDMDLSGWLLEGGVTYTFGEGSVLAAGGYLVVAADPARLTDALGPYAGTLADGGERIDLRNNGGRLIDTVAYGDDDPWPVEADGSGLSLAKGDPDSASDHAENWTASAELGGTPGQPNALDPLAPTTTLEPVALDATWTYDVSGSYPADDWAGPDYDDSAWERADAIFYAGAAQEDVVAFAQVTADNYFGLYLGRADGSDLRLVGEDSDGNWVTVEGFDLSVTPEDHLYLAAWEAPWDYGGPQMTIAEVELPADIVGTDASTFEWVLGPTDGSPGPTPPDPPPAEEELWILIEDANAAASWALPAVEADRASDPWGYAVGGSFGDATRFVWADTFADTSVTNTENTYVLLRSREPLLGSRGTTELSAIPTTITFRTTFSLDASPASAALSLECLLDDGAVVSLNGVEVLRENMPAGPVDATTLATTAVADATALYAAISGDALVRGVNVLAVEVHQAEPDDPDMTFGCALTARISAESGAPTVVLNEVAPAADSPFWVELLDVSASAQDTSGLVLASAGGEYVFPAEELASGELLALDDVGFPVEAGDVLFLYTADRSALLDAVRVQGGVRGRAEDGGAWRSPREATPGEPNVIVVVEDVVINEIQYHRAPVSREGEPVTERSEEWIELYNRGAEAVDLGGWQLVDAVAYELPAGTVLLPDSYLLVAGDSASLRAEHPAIDVVGNFSGKLDNKSDRILLLDARGNPADEVRYFDGGRWPAAADGGGASLELRDPRADNTAAEAWAASSEGARSEWVSYRYRGEADPSAVGPDGTWQELVVGLLDAGEVLIDDVSVIQDPDGTRVELIQNGSFDGGSASWRLLGNHRHSEIVPDPDAAANPVLRLVATGAAGHMHNHAESTLLQAISTREYEVSFRARWISGSNQVNTRLYFNRLPRTTRVEQPDQSGTPGAPNSTWVADQGPTFADLRQDVAVPAPYEPVLIAVSVDDPDGVEGVTLRSSVEGAAFVDQAMTEGEAGRWEARIEGQPAGTIVQFYVEAEDGAGSRSTFPAAGADSRALYKVDDDLAATNGLHNFRILLTQADSDWLHEDVNLMSDDLVGATVVYDEAEVFYDVGVRAKGSERGRPEVARLGYGVSFHSEQPFRGSHSSVLIDRSEGVGYGQREVLMNLVMTHAGAVSGEYNDLTQALTPLSEHTGPAELQIDRFSNLVLASQFADGASGTLFEYELVYYPLTTDDGTAEGLKLPQPDYVIGTPITDLGDDPEAYRWNFLIQNNEREDDYDRLLDLGQTFALSGPEFLAQAAEVIDVEQWLRAFAFATLSGAIDNYGGDGSQHNARFYVRPEDQRVLYFPHDLDFYGSASMAVVGNGDLARLLEDPANQRSYYGHLQDIVGRAYNGAYLAPWCDQLGALLPAQDMAGNCQFIADRADWVMYGAPDAVMALYPSLDFRVTTEGGADFSIASTEVVLEGEAWLDVRQVTLDGVSLELTWVDDSNWQVTVPLVAGPNAVSLVATDLRGAIVGTDSIVVTSTDGG